MKNTKKPDYVEFMKKIDEKLLLKALADCDSNFADCFTGENGNKAYKEFLKKQVKVLKTLKDSTKIKNIIESITGDIFTFKMSLNYPSPIKPRG